MRNSMIGAIKGTILDNDSGFILLAVGTAEDYVGYTLRVPTHARYAHLALGAKESFHVQTHVREDVLDLYAFISPLEKQVFSTVLQVNGIGPKLALTLLSHFSPDQLTSAILSSDTARITEVPGVGKKTAERIVLELKDSLQKKIEQGRIKASPSGAIAAGPALAIAPAIEALLALQSLGFRENDAKRKIDHAVALDPNAKTEEIIRIALQQA
jgi:holliday junction DNA helicase RuvA